MYVYMYTHSVFIYVYIHASPGYPKVLLRPLHGLGVELSTPRIPSDDSGVCRR